MKQMKVMEWEAVRMIKIVPNVISMLRIILSLGMIIFLKQLGAAFWILYFICGISDLADGWIARRYGVTSRAGEVLDSIGDVMLIGATGYMVLKSVMIPGWLWICLFMIAGIRMLSLLTGYVRYGTWATIHTYANKAAGLALFIGIPFYVHLRWDFVMILLCVLSAVSAIEELAIQLAADKLNRNITGIWSVIGIK